MYFLHTFIRVENRIFQESLSTYYYRQLVFTARIVSIRLISAAPHSLAHPLTHTDGGGDARGPARAARSPHSLVPRRNDARGAGAWPGLVASRYDKGHASKNISECFQIIVHVHPPPHTPRACASRILAKRFAMFSKTNECGEANSVSQRVFIAPPSLAGEIMSSRNCFLNKNSVSTCIYIFYPALLDCMCDHLLIMPARASGGRARAPPTVAGQGARRRSRQCR